MKRVIIVNLLLSIAIFASGCFGSNKSTANSQKKTSANVEMIKPTQKAADYNNWPMYAIKGLGEFQLPSTMELQSKDYAVSTKSMMDSVGIGSKEFDNLYTKVIDGKRVVFQQKGLNDANREIREKGYNDISDKAKFAYQLYARVTFNVENAQGMPNLGEHLDLTKADLEDFTESFLKGAKNADPLLPQLVSFEPAVIKKVNNNECLYIKYVTKLKNNPVSYNECYLFFNKDKIYRVTIMYRSSQSDFWTAPGQDIREVVKTIKFYKQ